MRHKLIAVADVWGFVGNNRDIVSSGEFNPSPSFIAVSFCGHDIRGLPGSTSRLSKVLRTSLVFDAQLTK